MYKHLKLKLKN